MLHTKPKISLNFYSILFVTFFKKLLKLLLSTYIELIESFWKISSKIDVKSKIRKIIEKFCSMQCPSPVIALQLLLPCHPIHHDGNSSICEWRMSHRIGFRHSAHRPARPPPPHLAPIYLSCIFRCTPVFWPDTLCCNFKDVLYRNTAG